MELKRFSRVAGAMILTASMVVSVGAATAAPQATKKIKCYKGTVSKVYKAAKCPRGWSLKKPAAKAASVAVNVEFKGTLSTVWSSAGVKATVSGAGNDKASGFSAIVATGDSAPSSQSAPIHGSGTLKGSMGNVNFVLNSDSTGTAIESAAPSLVQVKGTATIKSGTGKYAGATGTLTFKGTFEVGTTAAGAKEAKPFTASFTGNIKLK
jgi:hypothetical protein